MVDDKKLRLGTRYYFGPPNFQHLPLNTVEAKQLREAFRKHHPMPSVDYSAIEQRIIDQLKDPQQ